MKQKFLAGLSAKGVVLKTWLMLVMLLVGVGTSWGADADYTLIPSVGTNNGYAENCDVTIGDITWNVTGNAQMTPWRLGGKSITKVDREVYSKTAYASAVSKVDLTVGAASSITVNSLKLVYSTNSDFSNSSEISKTFASNSTISFEGDFPANAYYKFVFNVTVSSTSNKFVEFSKVELYNTTTPTEAYTVTFDAGSNGTCSTPSLTEENAGAGVTLPGVTAKEGWSFQGWSTESTPTSANAGNAGDTYKPSADITLYAYYKVIPVAPTFSPVAGTVEKGTEISFSSTTDGCTFRYTTDNTDPTASTGTAASSFVVNEAANLRVVAIKDGIASAVSSASYTVATHTATFYVNGEQSGDVQTLAKGDAITFPSDPEIDDVTFMGWATAAIDGTQDDVPTMYKSATMGAADITYYAVFATADGDETTETFGWEEATTPSNWKLGGTFTRTEANASYSANSGSYYGLTSSNSSVQFAKKVKVKSFSYYCVRRTNNTNTSIKIETSTNGTNWTEALSTTWNTFNSDGKTYKKIEKTWDEPIECYVRVNLVTAANRQLDDISITYGDVTYSDYCTTVSLDPKPTIVLSATELAEYAGNTNTSITASVSEGEYTGALEVTSSAEAIATASISEGTITISALTAGSATITVIAPTVTGFRANTATIAVTVSEKLAHGLAFNADALNLTVGDTEFSEPTLSNPNSLPVVYSLVYATPANEGKVATINAETGKITLADPSLSTETQGAVTVKALTDGDNSHAAGEVTYNLVVARKVTTTSWSNGGAAVNIDQDETATLPTATNDGERNIFYESSNTEVATIDYNTGAVTFEAYGTTTITAKTVATSDYAATSVSYELTFAPRYTVTFSINGVPNEVREATTGAGVVAPTVEPIEGKVFRGWAEATIDGTTNTEPSYVNVNSLSLNENKTLYAVFATASAGAEGSVEFDATSISGIQQSIAQRTQTTDGITFTFSSVGATGTNNNTVQMSKNSTLTQSAPFAGAIKSITFEGFSYSSTSSASMLVEGKKGIEGTYSTVQSCGSSYNGAEISFGSNEYDMFKISVGSERTVKFTKMTVSYSGVNYSDYCTTVKTTPTLSFAEATYNATMGEEFAAPELTNPQSVTVAYSSSETSVADFVDGVLTIKAPGTTTITASFAGNATYNEASASYKLVVAPRPFSLTVTSVGYATLCLPFNAVIPNSATVYTAEYQGNGKVELSEVETGMICANEGYIVANEGTHIFRATSEDVTAPTPNHLVGVTSQMELNGENNDIFIFANKNNKVGFYILSGTGKLGANKAYLQLPAGGDGRSFIGFGEDDETAINAIDAMPQTDGKYLMNNKIVIIKNGVMYNVNGQRMR